MKQLLNFNNKTIIESGLHLHNSSTRGCEYYRHEIFEFFVMRLGLMLFYVMHACFCIRIIEGHAKVNVSWDIPRIRGTVCKLRSAHCQRIMPIICSALESIASPVNVWKPSLLAFTNSGNQARHQARFYIDTVSTGNVFNSQYFLFLPAPYLRVAEWYPMPSQLFWLAIRCYNDQNIVLPTHLRMRKKHI